MSEYKKGTGMLFINHLDDSNLVPLSEDFERKLDAAFEENDEMAIQQILNDAVDEAKFTLAALKQQLKKLRIEVCGIKKMALDMVRYDFGGRVPHLATHARKHKTRKKNLSRASMMLERML